jgi:prevent-host-death family protein
MLDFMGMYGKMCVMRTATIRDAQHHFSALIRLVQRGEEIEVLSRRVPVARIIPARPLDFKSRAVDWSDHGEKLKKLWKGKKIKGASTSQLLDELRGER